MFEAGADDVDSKIVKNKYFLYHPILERTLAIMTMFVTKDFAVKSNLLL